MKFVFFNDTGRVVTIHPATLIHGCIGSNDPINHLETRYLELPKNTYPSVKMWDHGERGLALLVSPVKDN